MRPRTIDGGRKRWRSARAFGAILATAAIAALIGGCFCSNDHCCGAPSEDAIDVGAVGPYCRLRRARIQWRLCRQARRLESIDPDVRGRSAMRADENASGDTWRSAEGVEPIIVRAQEHKSPCFGSRRGDRRAGRVGEDLRPITNPVAVFNTG